MVADYSIEVDEEGRWLVVEGNWSELTRRAILDKNLDGVTLNYARGFRERDLSLLHGLPIRKLRVLARTIDDLTPVYSLAPTLESLSLITGARSRLDLARLQNLTSLSADWSQVAESISSATKVVDLYLGAYDEPDFAALQTLVNLQILRMKDGPHLESLAGLRAFSRLRVLEVAGARRLRDFDAFGTEAPSLQDLSLNSCNKLNSLDVIAALDNLHSLDLGNWGTISSLAPISKLTNLRELGLAESTLIEDNDLSPILALPMLSLLAMKSRSSYRPTVAMVQSILDERAAASGSRGYYEHDEGIS